MLTRHRAARAIAGNQVAVRLYLSSVAAWRVRERRGGRPGQHDWVSASAYTEGARDRLHTSGLIGVLSRPSDDGRPGRGPVQCISCTNGSAHVFDSPRGQILIAGSQLDAGHDRFRMGYYCTARVSLRSYALVDNVAQGWHQIIISRYHALCFR